MLVKTSELWRILRSARGINLKTYEGKRAFRAVLADTTRLAKKYNGSLSGEHGDGRLRGEFIGAVLGDDVYRLLQEVKAIFDPKGVFNAKKIVDTPPMDKFLRYEHYFLYTFTHQAFRFFHQFFNWLAYMLTPH